MEPNDHIQHHAAQGLPACSAIPGLARLLPFGASLRRRGRRVLSERRAVALTVVLSTAVSACSEPAPPPAESPPSLSLVAILANPAAVPDGKAVTVRGYLSRAFDPILYLTSEHAAAFDATSALPIADPTQEGSIADSDCFERFVSVTGTLAHDDAGAPTLRDPTRIEYIRPLPPRSVVDWERLIVVCWRAPGGT